MALQARTPFFRTLVVMLTASPDIILLFILLQYKYYCSITIMEYYWFYWYFLHF